MGTFWSENKTKESEITSKELYNIQANLRSFYLMIDCRNHEDYLISHIDLSISLHSPVIPENFRPNFSCDIIIYGVNLESCRSSRKRIETFLQSNHVPYHQWIYLGDSFSQYKLLYPYLCSDHPDYQEGRLFPSQIDDHVFLSNYGVASNPDILRLLGITHILNCTRDCPFAGSNGVDDSELSASSFPFTFLRVPVVDERDQQIHLYFQQGIQFIEGALSTKGSRVIIHCKHGQSRSATIAAAWLIHSKGSTTEGSIAYLQACRPKVSPNDGFINQLKAFEESLGAANVG
jgi:hypothetical protein